VLLILILLQFFSADVPVCQDPPTCDFPIPALSSINFSVDDIQRTLSSLPLGKAPGPDGINAKFLRNTVSTISPVLCRIFNDSIACGRLPRGWKLANITPVFKSGDRSLLSNYRPIALTSLVSKIMERLLANAVKDHLNSNCLLSDKQHGFVPNKSCVTQLMNVYHSWATTLDKRSPPRIDAVFLDMSKAFDRMPHHILVRKLASNFNIRGSLWSWIKDFLVDRQQRVTFVGMNSSWSVVSSGVPQGSVLGPLLFNLFINDISYNLSSNCVLFADDVLIYRPIRSCLDVSSLQHDLDELSTWSVSNGMTFNPTKSKIMHISRKHSLDPPVYTLSGFPVQPTSSVKYLGVTLNAQLSWNNHVKNVVSSANRTLGLIKTIAFNSSVSAKFCLYKSLVLPILEYGMPAWLPHTSLQTQALERVQKRATRFILGQRMGEMSYPDRLKSLNWSSLSIRRNFSVLYFIIKCKFNLIHCDVADIISVNHRYPNVLTFKHLYARTDALHLSAPHLFPRLWSSLPENIRNSLLLLPFHSFLKSLRFSVCQPHESTE
jgi:hypothetical protein